MCRGNAVLWRHGLSPGDELEREGGSCLTCFSPVARDLGDG